VILASSSPRRRELLQLVLDEFAIAPAEVDERPVPKESAEQTARRLAREKALQVVPQYPASLVIAADTVVVVPGRGGGETILGKPNDPADATRMLASLSGKTHTVLTAVCLVSPRGLSAFCERTEVTFRRLDRAEIEAYVGSGEPMDKAGAYAIQGRAAQFVERVEGSLSNVIGLPLEALVEALRSLEPDLRVKPAPTPAAMAALLRG
jgi:septum formation protein